MQVQKLDSAGGVEVEMPVGIEMQDLYRTRIESFDEFAALMENPHEVMRAAGLDVNYDSQVDVTIHRKALPGGQPGDSGPGETASEEGHAGIGISFHHGHCHWGIYIEAYVGAE